MALDFTNPELIRLLLIFWLPAQIVHMVAFMIANWDDIFIDWKIFYLGDLAGYAIILGSTVIITSTNGPMWLLWTIYIVYILIISTLLTDAAMYQESMTSSKLKEVIKETLIESILIPWGCGIAVGVISYLIFF